MSFALKTALEAVKFQVEPLLFDAVTAQIKKIRAENDYHTTSPAIKELSNLIRRMTGISLSVAFEESATVNASVYLPDIDRNHPLIQSRMRGYMNNREVLTMMRKRTLPSLGGSVDTLTGRVDGLYSELECTINLTTGLLNSASMEHEEIAAIFLHELGHLMSYFEYIHRTVTTNYALLAVAEAVVGENTTKRIDLIDATSKRFGYEADRLDVLNTTTSKDVAYSVLITQHIRKTRSELGANLYDQRGCEHLADQYAARMGAGTALTTALAKMHRQNPSWYSTAGFVLFEGLKIMLVLLSTVVISPLVLILMLVSYDPTDKIYDDPEARMKRIRNELLGGMKNKALTKERRTCLQKDLEIIDQALKSFNDRRSFYELLYTSFLPGARRQQKHMEHQQELESLANNELFAKAMNFTLI